MPNLSSQVLRIASTLPKGDPTRRSLLDAVRQAGVWGDDVAVRDLPPGLQTALKRLGFRGRDISVRADATPSMSDSGGDGTRGFFQVVDILNGRVLHETEGSWGGPNMFSQKPMDKLDAAPYSLKPGQAAIKGHTGGRMWAYIMYHPSDKDTILPVKDSVSLTPAEKTALNVLSFTSAYRADAWRREDLPGRYEISNPLIQGLISKGLVATNKAGALMLTTAGKNAR